MGKDDIIFGEPLTLPPDELRLLTGLSLELDSGPRVPMTCTAIDQQRGVVTFSSVTPNSSCDTRDGAARGAKRARKALGRGA